MKIGDREIGPEHPPLFIADVGSNHDGSLARYCELIALVAQAGGDIVKGQSFQPSKIVSRRGFAEMGQIGHQAAWEKDVYATYEAAATPPDWIPVLVERCREMGVQFMTTPYDLEAVDAIDPYVPAWKIGSGDITYHELIRHVASKGKPVLLATGASTQNEVRKALEMLDDEPGSGRLSVPVALLQCNSDYTGGDLRYANLRTLLHWQERNIAHVVGLSDHTPGPIAACAAIALGACIIEKHFTDDSDRVGPDHSFAMNPVEWRIMVEDAHATWETLGDGVKRVEENEREARIVQRRALRYVATMPQGDVLHESDVIPLRPCPEGGLEPYQICSIVGKTLAQDVEADALVELEDFDWSDEEDWK